MSVLSDTALQATRLLVAGDYYAALRFLNSLTRHRFTALYRREGEAAWNVVLYDKADPYTPQFPQVRADDTYCSMAMRECQVIVVNDSLSDARLSGHAARTTVQSYCGAPLLDHQGAPFGTLCHFDFEPVDASSETAELLRLVSALIDPQAVQNALKLDVDRRVDNLERTLPLLAQSMTAHDSWRDAFDEFAEPIETVCIRLSMPQQHDVRSRLDRLRDRFETGLQHRSPESASRQADSAAR